MGRCRETGLEMESLKRLWRMRHGYCGVLAFVMYEQPFSFPLSNEFPKPPFPPLFMTRPWKRHHLLRPRSAPENRKGPTRWHTILISNPHNKLGMEIWPGSEIPTLREGCRELIMWPIHISSRYALKPQDTLAMLHHIYRESLHPISHRR